MAEATFHARSGSEGALIVLLLDLALEIAEGYAIHSIAVFVPAATASTLAFSSVLPRTAAATRAVSATAAFLQHGFETGGVGGHDGDFELDGGDDDEFAEDVGEVGEGGVRVEFQKDGESNAGYENDDAAEREDGDEGDAFADGDLDCPEGADGEDDDEDIESYGL